MSSVKLWWLGAALLVLSSVLSSTFGQWIPLGPSRPDLMLIILIGFSLELRLSSAITLAIVAGFIKICTSGEPLALVFTHFLGSALLTNWVTKKLLQDIFWVQLGILGILCLVMQMLALFWIHPFHSVGSWFRFFFSHVLLTTFYTVLVAPFLWHWLDQLSDKIGDSNSNEAGNSL